MNHVLGTAIHQFILLNRSRLGLVRITRAAIVEVSFDTWNRKSYRASYNWDKHLDDQRDLYLQPGVNKPHRHIVVVRTLKILGDLVRVMLA